MSKAPEINGEWQGFDRDGFRDGTREVEDYLDGTIRIGGALYAADDLTITEDRITGPGGWYLTREAKAATA